MFLRAIKRKFSTEKVAVSVKEILSKKPIGSVQVVQGWASSVRKMGKVVFVDINDGSCIGHLQVVYPKESFNIVQNGASIKVTGTLQITEKGQLELQVKELNVIGQFDLDEDYPFSLKQKQSYDLYRQFLHFRPKIKYFTSMMRFRSATSMKIHQYFVENDFTLIHTPVLTSGDCEGAAETFTVKPDSQELINKMKKDNEPDDIAFFNGPAYLTVSGQLHLEAITRSIPKVYCFNPSFRAENSISRLHLSEFYMIEAEEAFIYDLESILKRIEDLVKKVLSYLLLNHIDEIEYMLKHNETDLKEHLKILENVVNKPFSVMTFYEAKELIKKNEEKFENSTLTPFSLTKAEEFFLVKNNNDVPVFVIDWPEHVKPFYMKKSNENSDVVKGVDLLVPNVGELCGGSLREDNYDSLKEKLIKANSLESLNWYLDLRKYGNVPTGGFGLGFERFLQFILNVQSIRDTIPFPRWPHHLQLKENCHQTSQDVRHKKGAKIQIQKPVSFKQSLSFSHLNHMNLKKNNKLIAEELSLP